MLQAATTAPAPAPGSGTKIGDIFGPPQPAWPMPVAEFLKGPYLEPADILLMRQRSSTFARLVRFFTGSFFSKAALVFFVPHREADFDKPFLIEATFRGIELTDLPTFCVTQQSTFVIAVKRLEADWFEQEERNLVRGFMINHVKAGYDYGALFDRFWDSLGRSQFVILRLLFGPHWAFRQLLKQRDPTKLNRFVGPGFIQWGYFQTTRSLIENELLPKPALKEVVFREEMVKEMEATGMEPDSLKVLAVTAEDIAQSPRVAWKYAILDGEVHAISSSEEFYALVAKSRAKWMKAMQRAMGRRSKPAGDQNQGGVR